MKKIIFLLMFTSSATFSQAQNITDVTIKVPEGHVFIKGDYATFSGSNGFNAREKIKSRKNDKVEVFWSADGVSRCYNLKSKSLIGC